MMWFSCAVANIVSVACFTTLAIHFEKWWIVLFALLFLVSVKSDDEEEIRE